MARDRIAAAGTRRQTGAAMVEYLVVAAMVAVLVFAHPGVVQELLDAMKRMYQAFTWALSQTIH